MVSVVAPRPTRFRYPVKVSGPADEGSAQVGGKGGGGGRGSSGCYLGLRRVSMLVDVKAQLGSRSWIRALETELTSQAWTESVPGPLDA
jgi:hypothetical protein